MENVNNGFSRRMRRLMARKGFTQTVMAERCGLTQGAISHILTGRTSMVDVPTLFKIADALDCDARWLATGEE